MRKALLVVALVALSLVVTPDGARAEPPDGGLAAIAVFNDDTYVQTDGAAGAEADNLIASLEVLGHEVTPFTGITATELAAVLVDKDVLVIPELENDDLAADLSDDAKQVIADFVAAGGSVVVFGGTDPAGSNTADLVNAIFGFEVTEAAVATESTKTEDAAATEFLDGPDTLPDNTDTSGLVTATLPEGSTTAYAAGANSTVAAMPFGAGSVTFLGWDWHNSDPPHDSAQDGGWQGVLAAAVAQPLVSIDDVTVAEPDTGTVDATFTVSLSFPVSEEVMVTAATSDGTAEQVVDYAAEGDTLTFARGETSQPFVVAVEGDTRDEATEDFVVTLSGAEQADIDVDNTSGTGSITDNDGIGYWLVASDGGIFNFTSDTGVAAAEAGFFGSTGAVKLNQPIVDMVATPSANGYWLVASDGGIFSFGDAQFHGSTGGVTLNQPVVGMAPSPTGGGYTLVAADGGIFTFGDAVFYGSTGDVKLNRPIVGMELTPAGQGYWMVASDGGIFSFGDAQFFGSTGSVQLNQPVVGMTGTPSGNGYWFVATDGGVFAFGDAQFQGSTGAVKLNQPIVDMAATPTGTGYWLAASDGGIFSFGDAPFLGSTGGVKLNQPVVGMDAA